MPPYLFGTIRPLPAQRSERFFSIRSISASGKVTVNCAPSPGSLLASIEPPCASAISWAIASPVTTIKAHERKLCSTTP